MLWMFQRVNYGPLTNDKNRGLRDLSLREWFVIAPICAMAIVMGVVPGVFLQADGAGGAQDARAGAAAVGAGRPVNAELLPGVRSAGRRPSADRPDRPAASPSP